MLTKAQIISITCDNASNNDTMVTTLGDLLVAFPGDTNRTQCFDHIINLIAKSIIKQFDVSKTAQKDSLDHDKKCQVLMVLAEDLEEEELETREGEHCEGDDGDDDNMCYGWSAVMCDVHVMG
jgi:hypothetical protein